MVKRSRSLVVFLAAALVSFFIFGCGEDNPTKPPTVTRLPAPMLLSPANTVPRVLPVNPTLNWNASAGATQYFYQLSTDAFFNTIIASGGPVTTTSVTINATLARETNYFWRVCAANAQGSSLWSEIWSFSTVEAAPAAPTLVTPANLAVNVSVTPTFEWLVIPGATSYHIQVSNSNTFTAPAIVCVDEQSLSQTTYTMSASLPSSNAWYWRVSATGIGGEGAWSQIYGFTTVPAVPATPILTAPSDLVTNVLSMPLLQWNAPYGAVSYRLQVSTDAAFSSPVVDSPALSTPFAAINPALASGTWHFWRVYAVNPAGTSAWSTIWRFKTKIAAPVLSSPADNATDVSITPTLTWGSCTGASDYFVEVWDSGYSTMVFQKQVQTNSLSIVAALDGGTYHWWVIASDGVNSSPQSVVWTFTTVVTPPKLLSPVEGEIHVSISPSLTWKASAGAIQYEYEIDTVSDFSSVVKPAIGTSASTTTTVTATLANGTIHYWRMRSYDANYTPSSWSSTLSFKTVIGAPVLTSPAANATNVSLFPTLVWNACAGAGKYWVEVWNNDYSQAVVQQEVFANSITIGVGVVGTYHWWVLSSDFLSWSPRSAVGTFTTAMTLIDPIDGATGISVTPTLRWNASAVAGVVHYLVEVDTLSDFSSSPLPARGVVDAPSTSFTVSTPLKNGATYYWRVLAWDDGYSTVLDTSPAWSFITVP